MKSENRYEKSRRCIVCDKEITYSDKYNYTKSLQRKPDGVKCGSCVARNKTGKKNPFYGKKHSKKTRDIIRKRLTGVKLPPERVEKMTLTFSGKGNPMYGKTVFDVWVEKYGKEEAIRRNDAKNKKKSKAVSGKNNPMYGKPTPLGAGKGLSGWYKGIYFRSLRELNYRLYLEENNIKWENAEKSEYEVKYENYDGSERTYRADFVLIDDKLIVECKPKKLCNTPLNKLKKKAATKKFKKMGYKYVMVDPGIPSKEKLKELIASGNLKMAHDISEWLK